MAEDEGKPEVNPPGEESPPAPEPTFLGQLVQRRSYALILVVFVFALILASAPFLFLSERSPYADALATYDRICAAARADRVADALPDVAPAARSAGLPALGEVLRTLPCVDRQGLKSTFNPVPGQAWGPERQYLLTLDPDGQKPVRLRFQMEGERPVWLPDALREPPLPGTR